MKAQAEGTRGASMPGSVEALPSGASDPLSPPRPGSVLGLLGSQDQSLLIGRSLTLEARTGVPSLGEGRPPADTAGCLLSWAQKHGAGCS